MSPNIHEPKDLPAIDALISTHPLVIIDFYADWCPPCRAIAPIFEKLATAHSPLSSKLAFAKVNTDHSPDISARYGVTAMPTFVFLRDGQVQGQPIRGAVVPKLESEVAAFAELAVGITGSEAGGGGDDQQEQEQEQEHGDKHEGDGDGEGAERAGGAGGGAAKTVEDKTEAEVAGHDTEPVHGTYVLGTEGGKRNDWKMSLNG